SRGVLRGRRAGPQGRGDPQLTAACARTSHGPGSAPPRRFPGREACCGLLSAVPVLALALGAGLGGVDGGAPRVVGGGGARGAVSPGAAVCRRAPSVRALSEGVWVSSTAAPHGSSVEGGREDRCE